MAIVIAIVIIFRMSLVVIMLLLWLAVVAGPSFVIVALLSLLLQF